MLPGEPLAHRSQQEQLLRQQFDLAYGDVVTRERLIYGDYLVPGAEPKVYAPATDLGQLSNLMETYLEDYNSTSTSPMKLVCFLDAIEHVSRICRWVKGWRMPWDWCQGVALVSARPTCG